MTRIALTVACLLVPAAAGAQQAPPPHDSLRGAVRTVDPRARTVAVTTGVGMALRVVQLRVPAELRVTAGSAALPLTALQPGDIVRVSFGWRPAGLVAYTIERIGRMTDGAGHSP